MEGGCLEVVVGSCCSCSRTETVVVGRSCLVVGGLVRAVEGARSLGRAELAGEVERLEGIKGQY